MPTQLLVDGQWRPSASGASVKVHVSSILNRVGVHNGVEAAILAYEGGPADCR